MQPLVSILIPAYNAGDWIAEAIQSALDQTWQRKEIIIVDDGSKDNSLEVARRFESPILKVISQENQGAAAARNTALREYQGDYVQWLDADDLLDPNKVEIQLRERERDITNRTLLSGAWASFMYRIGKAQFTPTTLWATQKPVEWLIQKMQHAYHMQTDNWLVSRELTQVAGPWDERLFRDNDGEYFCRVLLAANEIRFVGDAKSYYRHAGFQSITYMGGSSKKLESLALSIRLHIKYLRSLEDSPRTREVSVQHIRNWLHEFYPYRMDLADGLQKLGAELGGEVGEPQLSWKYQWIVNQFGWSAGRKANIMAPRMKNTLIIAWDKFMHSLESSHPAQQN